MRLSTAPLLTMDPAMTPAEVTLPHDEEVAQLEDAEPVAAASPTNEAFTTEESSSLLTEPSANRKRKAPSLTIGGSLTLDGNCKRCELGTTYKKGHHVSCPKSAYYGGAEGPRRRSRPFPTKREMTKETLDAHAQLGACKKHEKVAEDVVDRARQRLQEAQDQLTEALEKRKTAQDAVEKAKDLVVQAELKEPEKWNAMFFKLKSYKERHGNILFPRGCHEKNKDDEEYQSLCQWVKQERHRRNKVKWQRKAALDSIEFVWDPFEATWRDLYRELVLFREQHGHCNCPMKYDPCPYLPTWAATQRRNYRLLQNGKPNNLTEDRIRLLEELGFSWVHAQDSWQSCYDDLVAYKQTNGDFNVPNNYRGDPSLSRWMELQRTHYRMYQEGKPTAITGEQIKLLENIGFPWERANDKDEKAKWNARFQELVVYKNIHGNCSPDPSQNPELYAFCDQQREEYHSVQRGQASSMTQERFHLLSGIGFYWILPNDVTGTHPQT